MVEVEKDEIFKPYIRIYKQVLDGTRYKFPRRFWKDNYDVAPAIVRYLIEDILKWSHDDIKVNFGSKTLEDYKLSGLFKYVYFKNVYDVINAAYPKTFHPWELRNSPRGYWTDVDNCIKATRWLINEKLKWTKEDILKKYNKNVFTNNEFTGLLKWGWNGETYKAISLSFPEYDLEPWDLLSVPLTQLSKEESVIIIRWYIDEKMNWTTDEIKENWRTRSLRKEGIYRVVVSHFDNDAFKAIEEAYPSRFRRWDFPIPNGYWTIENSKEALKWLILDELGLKPHEAFKKISRKDIEDYNLRGMMELGFKSGLKEAINKTFDI